MDKSNYVIALENIYNEAINNYNYALPPNTINDIACLANNCFTQKGVFTVFVTLSIYKIIHPQQDIRNHQTQIENGFSGRSIDTAHITPTLKRLSLPAMSESGWLTRSLEQPYPYTLDYQGKIGNKQVKQSFLQLIDDVQIKNTDPRYILVELFKEIIVLQKKNKIVITPLKNPEKTAIQIVIELLQKQFAYNYNVFGGSKLPVLAFFSLYQILLQELSRYRECTLKPLNAHTTSDRTSKSAGDIEIFKQNHLFETVEIKLNKPIDTHLLRIVKDKIFKFNPTRYYIFSFKGIEIDDVDDINNMIQEVKNTHGCQIIINGVIATIQYYLRLISDIPLFITLYSELISQDQELNIIHKKKWQQWLLEMDNAL